MSIASESLKYCFHHEKIKFISSSHRVIFLLYIFNNRSCNIIIVNYVDNVARIESTARTNEPISEEKESGLNVFSRAITAVLYPGEAHVLDNHWFIHTRIFEIQTTEFPKNIMLERINCFLTHNSR